VVLNWLNLNLSLAGLSWPLYIGGQVSRIWSGSIQITLSVYDIISYFDYIYAWAYLTGLRGTKITGFISYTLVREGGAARVSCIIGRPLPYI
jgi:hypothetical protein